jgi:hypothetical protein
VPKPNIPENVRHALEECGPETIRTILFHGWANRDALPEAIQRIGQPSSERDNAIVWLKWKDADKAFWIKVNNGATVLAATAAVLAVIFSALALLK